MQIELWIRLQIGKTKEDDPIGEGSLRFGSKAASRLDCNSRLANPTNPHNRYQSAGWIA
jgi:hypothetical protein